MPIPPLLTIKSDNIPEAHYKLIKSVWINGVSKRTPYDRKEDGEYIDPPSKDAQACIVIDNLLNEPRFPVLSFCERGKYILEILGYKDQLVLPPHKIYEGVMNGNLGHQWPYAYSQRLNSYPIGPNYINPEDHSPYNSGWTSDQVENIIERLTEDYNSRRAVITTRCPTIDVLLKEDIPCLGEIHFRCWDVENDELSLCVTTIWRSRDLLKAWADNVVALSFWFEKIAGKLTQKIGKKVSVGKYTEFVNSLHIYGQDFSKLKSENGKDFFETFKLPKHYVGRSWNTEKALELEVIPQMEEILSEEIWKFSEFQKEDIRKEIERLRRKINV